ncbi:myosin-binding protein C, fast-type-like [Sapajus apella]|uniref:Myosin-binding protein C, fast-type n=1 Tax=Sapajus apella TaxID=9515 RepID=A0A6J3GQF3_SAPAP|nr:myosin-binding protein C, fast-type-like [Sapajus apella]
MPEAKPVAKKAPKGKEAPKEAPPKESPAEAPKEAPPEDQSPTAEEPTGIFLKKPDSISVENGQDVVVVAKVNGKELPGKPTIKWFKGKWLELGIKSGTRFSFKESHDSASNVYTVELRIGKVVLGDRGDYRLEVKAKDACDSCSFNIDVEGTLVQGGKAKDSASGGERQVYQLGVWRVHRHRFLEEGVQIQGSEYSNSGRKPMRGCSPMVVPRAIWPQLYPAPLLIRFHKLVIDDVRPEDEGDYMFVPDGYALSLSAKLNFLEIKVEYVPKQEPPKIHLDCSGKTSDNSIVVVAGNKLRLDVAITGEPPPVATWLKGDEVFTSTEGRVRVEKRVECSSFVIESAERADEGRYTIKVTNPVGEDVASIFLRVVDVPDPPEAVRVTSVGEDWAILVWEPPKYDGGQPVTGYLLERKKKGSQRWMKLNFEVFTETTYESTKMIEGVLYEMRVFAVNAIGVSQPSMNTKPFMPIAPTSEPLHLVVEDVTDTTTTLKWRPPNRIGAGGIDGYLVEYCLEGSEEWVPANTEPVERCGFTVKNLPTGARILFRVVGVNIAGRSEPATLVQPVTIREIAEPPKIRLPRHLRQTYVRKVGEPLNLVVPFQGKPRPQVVWTKGGAPLDTSRVHVRTSDFDTVFFVRQAARSDSGEYELTVQIENMKDTATIRIRVVEKAGPPINVMVKEVWGTNALVEWQAPKDDGNSEIMGYLVQKADKKTMEWFNVYERNRHTSCTVPDLIVGNEYYFRVYTENVCGLSDAPGVSKNTARILKTGITFKPFEYKEHDFRMPPKFLTPLIDRVIVAGYSAALNCAVRGHPKPKVVWMKNKMEIREDPKFLMTNYQGVLTLNIRRPSPFDAGTYSCRAVNELGEALAECKLEVRVPQ